MKTSCKSVSCVSLYNSSQVRFTSTFLSFLCKKVLNEIINKEYLSVIYSMVFLHYILPSYHMVKNRVEKNEKFLVFKLTTIDK